MPQSIGFHGAAETVTGSRHLLNLNGKLVLVDCGLFQGSRDLRQRNWEPFPVNPSDIDAVVITHAHTDHIGYLPRLVSHGYRGPIYATRSTIALCRVSLPDSARLQEEEARHANKHGYSRHNPALPLYTEEQAYASLKQFRPLHYFEFQELPGKATFRFLPAGHILGAGFAEIYFEDGQRILMGADLGRCDTPIIKDPTPVDFAEYLVIESTYGDRLHSDEDPEALLEALFHEAVAGGSVVLVPSFAIGRTQELLYYISRLEDADRIPRMPIFVDSPMATSTSLITMQHEEDHDHDMKILLEEGKSPIHPRHLEFVRDRNQSKALNSRSGPMVIISGSGMANGGRIVHHLKQRLDDPTTIVLFTGYQAEGTLGRSMIDGAPEVEIHGQRIAVRASVRQMTSLSAHADYEEMLTWLGHFKAAPKRTFIVHGDPPAQASLQQKIVDRLGWEVVIPKYHEEFELP